MNPTDLGTIDELVAELQLVEGSNKRDVLIQFRNRKLEAGTSPYLLRLAIALFDQGSASSSGTFINMTDNSKNDNSIKMGNLTGNGNAIGMKATATAGAFTQAINSSEIDQSLKNNLTEARILLDGLKVSAAAKSMTIGHFEQFAEEITKTTPDKDVVGGLWGAVTAGASSLLQLKPFIELGLLVAKVAGLG